MRYERQVRGQNFYDLDRNLHDVLARLAPEALSRWQDTLSDFGAWVGGAVDEEAEYTDRFAPPVLEAYDRDGELTNHIRHNPKWEAVSREVYRRGIVGLNYGDEPAPFAVTFAMSYLLSQSDPSLHCPVTMTGAVAYVLDRFAAKSVREKYLHQLTRMDGEALTGGTWATELHGGSDVGATTTVARRAGDHFVLNGLKWFTSNANGGLAVATARPEGAPEGSKGLGLYLVPTHLEDGSPNPMRLRRLKDKLGTRGVPTGEIDLTDTFAVEVAPPPDGFKLMMEALEFSRLHNAMASIGLQRRAFLEAVSYASHRSAFGRVITSYPMLQDQLIEMTARLEAGVALSFEAVRAFDHAHGVDLDRASEQERVWLRLATALAKYQTAEDAIDGCSAAIEIIGGNAYTYDYATPRLLRDAQVLTVWEGPANIQALEVLRMLGNRYPGFEAFTARIEGIMEATPEALGDQVTVLAGALRECVAAVEFVRSDPAEAQRHARKLMALMAELLGGALLVEEAGEALTRGDGRKALIARWYLERHFAPPARRGILPGQDWGQAHFEALIRYEPVAPSATPARRAAG
jgi:alkylation response protein AidB-like acyl-CoA dehydrogenase